MNIKRIDEDTIRCVMTADEMMEYGIEIEDFFKDKEKANEFLEKVLREAVETVGELKHHGMMSMQIMPLPQDKIAITFTEKGDENGFRDILNYIRQGLKGMEGLLPQADNLLAESKEEQSGTHLEKAFSEGGKEIPVKTEKGQKRAGQGDFVDSDGSWKQTRDEKIRIFCFDTLNDIGRFAALIAEELKIKSRLYKEEGKGFFLVLEREKMCQGEYNAVCEQALEFSRYYGADEIREAYLEEHAVMMVNRNAVARIRQIEMGRDR